MLTKTNPPEAHPAVELPDKHGPLPPSPKKSKKRGLVWAFFLLVVVGIAGYAVWRAGQPNLMPRPQNGGGGGRAAAEAEVRASGRCR